MNANVKVKCEILQGFCWELNFCHGANIVNIVKIGSHLIYVLPIMICPFL